MHLNSVNSFLVTHWFRCGAVRFYYTQSSKVIIVVLNRYKIPSKNAVRTVIFHIELKEEQNYYSDIIVNGILC